MRSRHRYFSVAFGEVLFFLGRRHYNNPIQVTVGVAASLAAVRLLRCFATLSKWCQSCLPQVSSTVIALFPTSLQGNHRGCRDVLPFLFSDSTFFFRRELPELKQEDVAACLSCVRDLSEFEGGGVMRFFADHRVPKSVAEAPEFKGREGLRLRTQMATDAPDPDAVEKVYPQRHGWEASDWGPRLTVDSILNSVAHGATEEGHLEEYHRRVLRRRVCAVVEWTDERLPAWQL